MGGWVDGYGEQELPTETRPLTPDPRPLKPDPGPQSRTPNPGPPKITDTLKDTSRFWKLVRVNSSISISID